MQQAHLVDHAIIITKQNHFGIQQHKLANLATMLTIHCQFGTQRPQPVYRAKIIISKHQYGI